MVNDKTMYFITRAMLLIVSMTLIGTALTNRDEKNALQSDIVKLTEKLNEAKQVLAKQDSIIRNFDPVITVKIPCEHARK